MDQITQLITITASVLGGFLLLALAANGGVDSRPSIGDDHAR